MFLKLSVVSYFIHSSFAGAVKVNGVSQNNNCAGNIKEAEGRITPTHQHPPTCQILYLIFGLGGFDANIGKHEHSAISSQLPLSRDHISVGILLYGSVPSKEAPC